ncbi:LysR substrate-binding domain-containing protein [Chitinophaga arvensicola]|uniref:LysR family transcriptional regulator, cyn operon transcriptional activator n=1 Tax=Chitinophaga arvensicola TaxID=29529 RepID=A0A1I0S5C2_9BACT|nr:LysR substrate-binding domain-containing protein [Chitinophaga arvensicola]SEW50117.1 LysR family transcriptional regulator, cyn operon transcriptional activator [Chitinophaga arvensicola]
MELRQLMYFVKAAEMAHFTAAAEALYITQSTLSQQIKQLENELGMLLFDRIGKHVHLTEAGGVFLLHARQILLDVEKGRQAIQDLQNMLSGDLRIGVTYAFTSFLLPALTTFPVKYPGISIYVEYGTTELLESKLRASELDLLLAFQQDASYKDFDTQELFQSRLVMAVSKKHKLAGLKKISLSRLADIDMIFPSRGFSARDSLDEALSKNKIQPAVRIEMNDVHSILLLVEKGHWATLLNERALRGWKNLVAITLEGKELQRRAYIIWQRGTYRKKAADLFIQELLKQLPDGTQQQHKPPPGDHR